MGTETIRVGTSRMFDMFQHQTLNKRFVYVFLEGVIITLFPQNKFAELFQRLHSRSERVAIHLAKMKEDSESAESSTRRRRRWLWEVPHQAEVIVGGGGYLTRQWWPKWLWGVPQWHGCHPETNLWLSTIVKKLLQYYSNLRDFKCQTSCEGLFMGRKGGGVLPPVIQLYRPWQVWAGNVTL